MDGGATEIAGDGSLENLGRLESQWNTPGIAAWCLVLFGAVLLNATLLLAFVKRPGLRTISNRFVMNLTVSNLLTATVLTSLLILDSSTASPPSSFCVLAEGFTSLVTSSSIFAVLLIALDQYLAVVDPLRYRTRISNVKCFTLIIIIWLISTTFALLAAFNPQPRGLWSVCNCQSTTNSSRLDLTINSTVYLNNPRPNFPLLEIQSSLHFIENSTSNNVTHEAYGLIYAVAYAVLVYLLPFIGVCWIYVNIYSAAHENSERTRRTGSRPALSSASFLEDYSDELRRIPKISSLSSIDESLETMAIPSQKRRRLSSPIAEESSVIFTVGSEKQLHHTKDTTIATKQSQKSRFPHICEARRKSSHDLMIEEMIKRLRTDGKGTQEQSGELVDSSSVFFTVGPQEQLHPTKDRPSISTLKAEFLGLTAPETDGDSDDEKKFLDETPEDIDNLESEIIDATANTTESSNREYFHQYHPPIVTITPPSRVSLHRVASTRSTSSYINSLKHRISNGSLFKYREETRAARISALVIVMGFICWSPFICVLLARNWWKIPHVCDIIGVGFILLATYISPLLFGYRSRRVKRELRKFFCFRNELSYKNNRSLMAKKVLKRRNSGNFCHLELESKYNIFNCVYGKNKWPKDKVHFVQVPETALAVETCRSSFSSGASTQISSTSTEEC